MSGAELYVLVLIVLAITLFATEWLPMDVVGVLVLVLVYAGGILDERAILSGFSNPALIAVGALFIVSEGAIRTGAVGVLSRAVVALAGNRKERILPVMIAVVMVGSAFINNTPIVVLFTPIALGLADRYGFPASKLMMPISFAALLGGTCTLIGTSSNLVINSFASRFGFRPLGMFEFLPLGLVFGAFGFAYMILGQRLLRGSRASSRLQPELLKEYLTEIRIVPGSPLCGREVSESGLVQPGLRLLQLIRGERIYWPPLNKIVLAKGDVLLVKGELATVAQVLQRKDVAGPNGERDEVRGREWTLAEVVITPNSRLVGRTLERVTFRKYYGVAVLAIQRAGEHIRSQITELTLRTGDVLLIEGDPAQVEQLRGERDFLLLEGAAAEAATVDLRRAPLAIAILLAVVICGSAGVWPMEMLAVAGALGMVLTGCLTNRRAYSAVNWDILMLVGCMIALGLAMEKTGLAKTIASGVHGVAKHLPAGARPYVVLSLFFLVATIISNFVSNNAAALLLVPISLELAASLGVDGRPFLFAVVYGVSLAFILPTDNTHLIVYGPGGYRFADFVRFGAPLNLGIWVLASIFLPVFWPFWPR